MDQTVTIELKNDLAITGTLVSVDQFLNIKLDNIKVVDEARYPHMVRPSFYIVCVMLCSTFLIVEHSQITVKNCFIRGSVVRYVQLPSQAVDTALLQDAARREAAQPSTVQQANVRVK